MGKTISKLFGKKKMKVLMLGLDAAGKTTILYKLKLGQPVVTIPTVGFNVESLMYKNIRFDLWDIGGQDMIRKLWRYYFTETKALIFVVDSSDHNRIELARRELYKIVSDNEMRGIDILVYANKQDRPRALTPHQLQKRLDLTRIRNCNWYVMPSCAITGDGLYEGFDWLADHYK